MKSLAILGRGKSWVNCPEEGEVWAVSHPKTWKNISKLFIFDPIRRVERNKPGLLSQIARLNTVVYLKNIDSDIPTSVRFPIEDVIEYFGENVFFTNSICYVIAYAIMCNYEEINLFGVDQKSDYEYVQEKNGVEFWVGVAIGRGVKVNIPEGSLVCRVPGKKKFYGYDVNSIEEIMADKGESNG